MKTIFEKVKYRIYSFRIWKVLFNKSGKEDWAIKNKDIKDKWYYYLQKKNLGLIKDITNQTKR